MSGPHQEQPEAGLPWRGETRYQPRTRKPGIPIAGSSFCRSVGRPPRRSLGVFGVRQIEPPILGPRAALLGHLLQCVRGRGQLHPGPGDGGVSLENVRVAKVAVLDRL